MGLTTVANVLSRSLRAHGLGAKVESVFEAVKRAGCIYGSAPTCYLSLVVRTRDFSPGDLDNAVLSTRELVRVRAMRGSVYLVPRELVSHALALTTLRPVEHYARLAGIEVGDYEPLAERIEGIVATKPGTAAEIRKSLGPSAPKGSGLSAILGRMNREGRIVRAGVRGGTSSQSYEYARMADWIDLPGELPSPAEALRAFAPLWLQANGPATVPDFAWWAGTSLREAKKALEAVGAKPMEVNGIEGELYATEDLLADLAGAPDANEVHLIPCWDSYVMAHRDRSRYLDDALKPYVIDGMGNVTNVVLRAGRIAGIWDIDGGTLLYALFESIPQKEIEAAASRLSPLHDVTLVKKVVDPSPLAETGRNAFLAPLQRRSPKQ